MTVDDLTELRYHAANGNRSAERLLNKYHAAAPAKRSKIEQEIGEFLDKMAQRPRRWNPVRETK